MDFQSYSVGHSPLILWISNMLCCVTNGFQRQKKRIVCKYFVCLLFKEPFHSFIFFFFMIAKVWNSLVSIDFCVRVFVFDELFDLSGWYNCVDQITCNKTIDLNVYTSLAFIIRVEPEFCMRGKWCSECRIFTNGNERKSQLISNDKNGCEMVPMDLH